MDAEHRLRNIGHLGPQVAEQAREFFRDRVPHRVRNINRRGARGNDCLDHLGQILGLRARRVFRRKLDIVKVLTRQLHTLNGLPQHLVAIQLQLVLPVYGARGKEYVQTPALRVSQRLAGLLDVARGTTGQCADHRPLDLPGDHLHGLEITRRGGGKTGLDNVDAQLCQRQRHPMLLLQIHAASGGLFAIAQRRVKYDQSVSHYL